MLLQNYFDTIVTLVGALCDINAMLMYSNGLCSACRRERALKKSALVHQ